MITILYKLKSWLIGHFSIGISTATTTKNWPPSTGGRLYQRFHMTIVKS